MPNAAVRRAPGTAMRVNPASDSRNASLPLASRKCPTIWPALLIPQSSVRNAPGMSMWVNVPSAKRKPCSPGTIKELPNDVSPIVQPVRFGVRGSWNDIDGRKLSFRKEEAVSSGRDEEPSLPPVVDAGRDRRARIGYVDGLKSERVRSVDDGCTKHRQHGDRKDDAKGHPRSAHLTPPSHRLICEGVRRQCNRSQTKGWLVPRNFCRVAPGQS